MFPGGGILPRLLATPEKRIAQPFGDSTLAARLWFVFVGSHYSTLQSFFIMRV